MRTRTVLTWIGDWGGSGREEERERRERRRKGEEREEGRQREEGEREREGRNGETYVHCK